MQIHMKRFRLHTYRECIRWERSLFSRLLAPDANHLVRNRYWRLTHLGYAEVALVMGNILVPHDLHGHCHPLLSRRKILATDSSHVKRVIARTTLQTNPAYQ